MLKTAKTVRALSKGTGRPSCLFLIFLSAVVMVFMSRPVIGQPLRSGRPAPEISGNAWINSKALTLSDLKGRVVLVEFWTYGCINCRNVIPHLRAWHEKYTGSGLTIVGVHTPEFFWEKPLEKVKAAAKELDIRYPVVQDNGYEIWRRYGIWAWPTTILVDKKGIIRYTHVGEGAYAETESSIRRLLAEPDA